MTSGDPDRFRLDERDGLSDYERGGPYPGDSEVERVVTFDGCAIRTFPAGLRSPDIQDGRIQIVQKQDGSKVIIETHKHDLAFRTLNVLSVLYCRHVYGDGVPCGMTVHEGSGFSAYDSRVYPEPKLVPPPSIPKYLETLEAFQSGEGVGA